MRVSYDRNEDILTIETAQEGAIDHAEHVGTMVAHLTQDGRLVLLEILDASDFLASVVKVTARGESQELPSRT